MLWFVLAALVAGITQRLHAGFFVLSVVGARACLQPARGTWALAAGFAACAFLFGFLHTRALDADIVCMSRWTRSPQRIALTGWVCGFPRSSFYGTSFLFATRCDGKPTRVLVYAARFNVNYGDSLRLEAVPARQRGHGRLRGLGAAAVVRVRNGGLHRLPGHNGGLVRRHVFWPAHRGARGRLQRALGRNSGLPIALVLGERGLYERGLDRRIRRLGISHLFALSGLHLGIIVGWVLLGVGRAGLGRTTRAVALGVALVVYTGFVGEIESLRRASAMALLFVLARASDRRVTAWDALTTAFFLLLSITPGAVFSVAFQLSFSATAAIILVSKQVQHLYNSVVHGRRSSFARRFAGAAVAGIVASAAIQVIVVPLQIHYFGRISAVGPAATMLFLPAVLAVIVTGLMAAILAPVPAVGAAVVFCADIVAHVCALALHRASELAPPLFAVTPPNPWLWGAAILWWHLRRRRPGYALGGAAVMMILAFFC